MEPKAFLLLCFSLVLSIGHLHSQTSSTSPSIILSDSEVSNSLTPDMEWEFFEDSEDQKVYIDFAELGGNFAEIIVQDNNGKPVFREDLLDLPSNSIYELDLSEFNKGDYTIKLKTYTEPIFKKVSVK